MSKTLFLLSVALMVGPSCANHSNSRVSNIVGGQNTPTSASATSPIAESGRDPSQEIKKLKDAPTEFKGIDFKNISYPISWKHRTISLKDGHVEFFEDKYLGNAWFDLEDVDYVDLIGNGKLGAIVQLNAVMCGASCDGGSQFFYFFSIKGRKLTLLSRIETGSLAYTCGLKSFVLRNRSIVLEAFRKCSFDGLSLMSAYDGDEGGNKFIAREFTRLKFEFNGTGFVLKTRELHPNPDLDVKNYRAAISINNN
jgi:hypothetical protein